MKKIVFMILIILLAFSYSGYCQKKGTSVKVRPDTVSVDSLEHRLIIFDSGFDSWLATQPPKEFYSKEYYEQRNRLYVMEWNSRYLSAGDNGLYGSYIEYYTYIDYGLDINYRLYYYFKYFEKVNKVTIYPIGR